MVDVQPGRCWCGESASTPVGAHYRLCAACGTAVLVPLPADAHFDVVDDESDFYGRHYWLEFQRGDGRPSIEERARLDLRERCVFWLDRMLQVVTPPGRSLEIGCGHGAFVRLLEELGFEAMGTELSPWVVEYARRTFGVRVLRGSLDRLDLEPGFRCIAAFDVLEHVRDPLDLVRRCRRLLDRDGVLLLQTPRYRGEGPDWPMFQEKEHVFLFSEVAIRSLLERAGFSQVTVQPSLFPYDMWVVAGAQTLPAGGSRVSGWTLPTAFAALLDLRRQLEDVLARGEASERDRAARLRQVETLTALLRESEADRAARLQQIEMLTERVCVSDADRVARLEQIEALTRMLKESEMDRAARFEQIEELTRMLKHSEEDRTARLEQVDELTRLLREAEARLARIEASWAWRLFRRVRALRPGLR